MSGRKFNGITQQLISAGAVLFVASVCYLSIPFTGYKVAAFILLMTVSVLAMLFDMLPVLTAAVLSALIWNFFFIPPVYTFHIDSAEDLLMFLMYFVVALVNAVLTLKIREAEKKARDKEERENTIRLYNTLLNSLSHEMRTPLATIIGAVDTLNEQSDKLSTRHQATLLNEISLAGIRLNRQVENLLNMSRLETGMLKPVTDWSDVNELVFSVIQKFEGTRGHRKIDFEENNEMPLVKLDAGLMEQVLNNIIHNAVTYTPDDSVISVEVSYQNNACILKISDSGKGFQPDEINYIFDKFYRVPGSKTGGVGLGLSIAKGFVEAHHGRIILENRKEGGARFIITVPAESSFISNFKNG